jgi:hypothetical protein
LKESSSQELLFHLLVKETWSDARFNILQWINFSWRRSTLWLCSAFA